MLIYIKHRLRRARTMAHQRTRQRYFEQNPPTPSGYTGPKEVATSEMNIQKARRLGMIILYVVGALVAAYLIFRSYR